MAQLYQELELGGGRTVGDVYYVTARDVAGIAGVTDWLATHSVPLGPIDTGTSGMPWVARPEKVSDISAIMLSNPGQSFILTGDTAHVDPEVQRDVLVDATGPRSTASSRHELARTRHCGYARRSSSKLKLARLGTA